MADALAWHWRAGSQVLDSGLSFPILLSDEDEWEEDDEWEDDEWEDEEDEWEEDEDWEEDEEWEDEEELSIRRPRRSGWD